MEYFGLPSLDGLPDASELRRIPVQRPESLLTVDPGLATAPESPKLEESPLENLDLPLDVSAAAPGDPSAPSGGEPSPTPAA